MRTKVAIIIDMNKAQDPVKRHDALSVQRKRRWCVLKNYKLVVMKM